MDIPSNDLNGDCGCIHSNGFQSNQVKESISTFHNNGNSVQNGDFLQSPEELDPKTMEFEKLLQLMHPEFVLDYLTRLLNFLKSDEHIISFPNIAPFKAAFLKKLVRKLEYKGFNDTCKGIASEIIDILDENKAVYKWIFTYDHGRFAKDVPAYRKIFYKKRSPNVHEFKIPCTKAPKSSVSESPKSNTSSVEELKMAKTDIYYVTQKKNSTEDILNTTQSTDTSECSEYKSKHTLKKRRMYTNRQKLIQELLPEFVETSLNSILSLVEDEMRASLIFNDVTENEARFYKSIISVVKSRKNSSLFPKSCKCILVQLKQLLKKSSKCWEIRVEEDIVDRDNKLRDVTLTKVPIGESLSPDNRSVPAYIKFFYKKRSPNVHEFKIPCVSEPNESVISRGSDGNRSIESNLSRDRSISNDKRSQRSWNGIQFECGGRIELAENANSDACRTQANGVPGREHGTHSKEVELTAHKSRLIEALSVPLECNKAVRMMRLMGWQGGALGARGDGITEPIMPTLNIVTGAGLGHSVQATTATTKQQNSRKRKQSDRIPVEFRIELLENIHALLRSDASERDVAYAPPLCKKEKRFLNNSLKAFNRRNRLGLNDRIEQQLVQRIYEGMLRDPELVLKRTISEDSTLLKLSKSTNIYVLPSRKNKKKVTSIENNRVQVFEQPDPSIKSELLTFEDVLSYLDKIEIPHGVSTKKTRKFFAYRLCFLNKILDFLKSSDEQREYRLDSVLSCKYRNYLKNITKSMNLKDRIVAANVIEIDILTEIKANLGEYYLDVKFSSGNQKFLIEKEFIKKRFSNTSVTQIADDKSSVTNNNSSVTNNNSSVANDNSSVANDNSSVANDNSSVANDNSSVANDNSSVANDNSSVANDNSSVANDNISVANNNSCVANDNSSVANDNSSVANDISSVANDNSSVANDNSSVANDNSSVANNNICVANDNSSVANDNSNSIDTDDDTTVINDDDIQAVIVSTSDISVYDTLQST